jgi:hypothetical protein
MQRLHQLRHLPLPFAGRRAAGLIEVLALRTL